MELILIIMNKLTLKIEYSNFLDKELNEYLSSLNGVLFSKVDMENNEIYIEYDSAVISIKVLKMEIILYLNLNNTPSIISFDKHYEKGIKEDVIIIDDLCCEYCLKGMIEDLLEYDAIKSAYTNFNYVDKNNVNIYITYDNKALKSDELNKLKNKLNNY